MDINALHFIMPLFGVVFFSIVEKSLTKNNVVTIKRFFNYFLIYLINFSINLVLATFVLIPFIYLISPLKLASIASLDTPRIYNFIFSFLLIDLAQYINHRVHHKIPFLWKLHRLHHSEKDVNALTSFLHNPLEILSGFFIVVTIFFIFDIPIPVIIAYTLISSVQSAFTHLNILIPEKIDKYLRFIIITPNVHRIHHSKDMKLGNSNFGQIFIFWDLIFRTFIDKSNKMIHQIEFGIQKNESPENNSLFSLLSNPFK
jgi:sterol desaturase/sphingolipid hydroxylase (fatty acid hydroxylase superfamily)